jgi:hypothetical protein
VGLNKVVFGFVGIVTNKTFEELLCYLIDMFCSGKIGFIVAMGSLMVCLKDKFRVHEPLTTTRLCRLLYPLEISMK